MVSLPAAAGSSSPLLGFLPTTDFNLQQQAHQQVQHQFAAGDTLTASVAALPSAATAGRLLLSDLHYCLACAGAVCCRPSLSRLQLEPQASRDAQTWRCGVVELAAALAGRHAAYFMLC